MGLIRDLDILLGSTTNTNENLFTYICFRKKKVSDSISILSINVSKLSIHPSIYLYEYEDGSWCELQPSFPPDDMQESEQSDAPNMQTMANVVEKSKQPLVDSGTSGEATESFSSTASVTSEDSE